MRKILLYFFSILSLCSVAIADETVSSGLTLTFPSPGQTNWATLFKNSFATPISSHQHTGSPDGLTLVTDSYSANSITGPKIRLANDECLRARNAANSADVCMLKLNTSDTSEFAGDVEFTSVTGFSGSAIGTDLQAWDDDLDDIAALTPTDSNFMVGDGTNWVKENASTTRTSLGLGSLATLSTVNDGNWSGTDLAVANGGTGSSTASGARTALSAAALGANTDITSLTGANIFRYTGSPIQIGWDGVAKLRGDNNDFTCETAAGCNLGNSTRPINGITGRALFSDSGQTLTLNGGGSGGTAAEIHMSAGASTFWIFGSTGLFVPSANNSYDVGETSTPRRVRTIYLVNSPDVSSDSRLKTEISGITPSEALADINLLRPVRYIDKDGMSDEVHLGFMAQEVEPHIPEVVSTGEDVDGLKSMQYERLVPHLVAAIQKLDEKVEQLQVENALLRADVQVFIPIP